MIWFYFTTGRGPGECQIACQSLCDIFIKEAKIVGLDATLLESREGPHGLLSALVAIEGNAVEKTLAQSWEEALATTWEGTVQWTCASPIRKGWGRKNWFISVSVIRPPNAAQELREADLQFQTYRASGPGGQHVQKTDSAVRVTHLPTGLVAQAQEERSQHRNKSLAIARLAAMLAEKAVAATKAVEHEKWTKHDDLERGNPVRKYKGTNFQRV